MSRTLARISYEPRLIHRALPELPEPTSDAESEFQTLADLLRTGTGVDFSLYRQTTVRRRALRRVAVLKQRSLHDYVEYIRENPDEAHALAQDILIRVTRFSAIPAPSTFYARKCFPALIRKTPQDRAARIWVAGCSTGEEAYSIAMCLVEVAEQMRSRMPIQVFATDINEAAIEKARRGTYIDNIVADVFPERLSRFFVREGRESASASPPSGLRKIRERSGKEEPTGANGIADQLIPNSNCGTNVRTGLGRQMLDA